MDKIIVPNPCDWLTYNMGYNSYHILIQDTKESEWEIKIGAFIINIHAINCFNDDRH